MSLFRLRNILMVLLCCFCPLLCFTFFILWTLFWYLLKYTLSFKQILSLNNQVMYEYITPETRPGMVSKTLQLRLAWQSIEQPHPNFQSKFDLTSTSQETLV